MPPPSLVLQGADNLEAADASGLNSLVIDWLQESVQDPSVAARPSSGASSSSSSIESGSATASGGADEGRAAAEGEEQAQQRLLLRQQLLALLRQSGSYSISGERWARCRAAGPASHRGHSHSVVLHPRSWLPTG